jgi:mannose-6-phosphate isomerase-like protein (cupin superfamily)
VTLDGTAVVEVKSGEGLVRLDGKEQKLQLGTTFTIPQGASFVLENDSEVPLAMQVYLIRAE